MGSSKRRGSLAMAMAMAMALVVMALAGAMATATATVSSNFIGVLVESGSTLAYILGASKPILCPSGTNHTEKHLSGRTFYCRWLEGKPIIAVRSGHGMVNTAIAAQSLLLLEPKTQLVVHYSRAGSPNLDRKVGDVLISSQVAHTGIFLWQNLKKNEVKGRADLRFADYTFAIETRIWPPPCGKIGNKLNRVWFRDAQVIYSPDKTGTIFWVPTQQSEAANKVNLTKCADVQGSTKCLGYIPSVVSGGKGCSSDILVQNKAYAQFLGSDHALECDAIDRGAAAVALVLKRQNVASVSVKTVSNYAGIKAGPDKEDRAILANIADKNAVEVIKAIVTDPHIHA